MSATQPSPDRPLHPVANNLRRVRVRRGLSLSAVARTAGISKSTLSELEQGKGNPSIDTLWALAQALNITFSELFVDDGEPHAVQVLRREEMPVVATEMASFLTRHLLTLHGRSEVELYVLELVAGYRREARAHPPGVVEHVLVLEGKADVGPEENSVELGLGDFVSFPADRPHHYQALDGPARLLAIHDYS
jgi:XRE family transcriptional regulator, regulator of sulfur utilization